MANISEPSKENRFNVIALPGFMATSSAILLLLALPLMVFVIGKTTGLPPFACQQYISIASGDVVMMPCYPTYVGLSWLAIFSCAWLFGAIGVMISLILRRQLDIHFTELKVVALLTIVYATGAVFATLILCLFVGGFLQGSLFPKFENTSWLDLDFRARAWGQLAVWAFLAGFSERLMPSLFDKIVEKIDQVGTPPAKSTI